jgi:hypothetical protein
METELKRTLLSTSSPEGLSVAAKITPTRIANLLIRKGPLPIRHITGQLALEVHGFEMLSLSKQRRLIMAAMEQTDPENNVLFEKIGWGQWAVRKVDSDYIVTEGTEAHGTSADDDRRLLSVHDLRNQTGVKLGWTKKQQPPQLQALPQSQPPQWALQLPPQPHITLPPILPQRRKLVGSSMANPQLVAALRRDSITAERQNLHNVKLPGEGSKNASTFESDLEDDYALDGSESETDIESDEMAPDDSTVFSFEDEAKTPARRIAAAGSRRSSVKSPPPSIKFANRVPLKVSPPPGPATMHGRRKLSLSTPGVSKQSHTQRHMVNRSRLNLAENLDNYIVLLAKNSGASLLSPPHLTTMAGPSSLSSLPWGPNYIHHASPDSIAATMSMGRRKLSFNESHLRSTLSTSVPKQPERLASNEDPYQNGAHAQSATSVVKPRSRRGEHSDTDEEDWAAIGAEQLRNALLNRHTTLQSEERNAAYALVDLMSI